MPRTLEAHAIAEGKRLVRAWFTAWNRADGPALLKLLHVPNVRLPGARLLVSDTEADAAQTPDFRAMASGEGWHASLLDGLEVHQWSEDKVHGVVALSRCTADGQRYATGQAVYVVTRNAGRWAIQLTSGTLTPVAPDRGADAGAIEPARRALEDWIAGEDRAPHLHRLVHLPFVELSGATMRVHRSVAELRRGRRPAAWHHSALHRVTVREHSPQKVTLEVDIARFDAAGAQVGCEGALAIVTERVGRWAPQMLSTF
jgi:hypothetical protein